MDAIGSERLANNLSKTKHTLSRRCDILEAVGERERERESSWPVPRRPTVVIGATVRKSLGEGVERLPFCD